jgi:hypothetical protein
LNAALQSGENRGTEAEAEEGTWRLVVDFGILGHERVEDRGFRDY